jgi:4-amino-4-deoxy-L-arabinose transferase-like glycosyltransferase
MTVAEEDFSLHWGILSIFGTTPWTADSWGAFADQAPYLSLGKSPFVNTPLPMWAMVAWTNITSQTLPNTRFLSALLASIALCSSYFIAKRFLKYEHALFAPGFLAGSLMWNDTARHASQEIWGITFVLTSIALFLSMINSQHSHWYSLLIMSLGLCFSVMILMLSSFTGIALLFAIIMCGIFMFLPTRKLLWHIITSIAVGFIGGYSWYWQMDFPFFSQIADTILLSHYIPRGLDLTTLIIDFALLPFFIMALFIGIKRFFIKDDTSSKALLFMLIWFVIAYGLFGFSAMIIPPFVMIALIGLLSINESIQSIRIRWILIGYALVFSAFGIAPRLVEAMSKGIVFQEWSILGFIPILLFIGIPISSILLNKSALSKLTYSAMSRALITLVIAALIKVAFANLLGKTRIEPEALAKNSTQVQHSLLV